MLKTLLTQKLTLSGWGAGLVEVLVWESSKAAKTSSEEVFVEPGSLVVNERWLLVELTRSRVILGCGESSYNQ